MEKFAICSNLFIIDRSSFPELVVHKMDFWKYAGNLQKSNYAKVSL